MDNNDIPTCTFNLTEELRLSIPRSHLNLNTTLKCGQSFIWRNIEPNQFMGVINTHIIRLDQRDDEHIYMSAFPRLSKEEMQEIFDDYFQMAYDYDELIAGWMENQDEKYREMQLDFECALNSIGGGLRLIRQVPWECLICFMCSQNNNITRIGLMIESLCENYGEVIAQYEGMRFYRFPTIEELKVADEGDFNHMGFGYRSKYMVGAIKKIEENGGADWLLSLRLLDRVEAEKELTSLYGIGPKVASCISLFSLDKLDSIPVDTHVHQIAKRYDPSLTSKAVTKTVIRCIYNMFNECFGEYAGWAHSIMFASELKEFKKRKEPATPPIPDNRELKRRKLD
eukprot:TRINITY_DN10039_c0_g1_i1.p1 TRINITY_DN10039_c0_g1~~TRINITY_DN10039_c0_g1_i1.p1  ORF type:complete len:374 (+),score=51.39 TRINITY_DN10039_c0_g1_i1:101-1123(+)